MCWTCSIRPKPDSRPHSSILLCFWPVKRLPSCRNGNPSTCSRPGLRAKIQMVVLLHIPSPRPSTANGTSSLRLDIRLLRNRSLDPRRPLRMHGIRNIRRSCRRVTAFRETPGCFRTHAHAEPYRILAQLYAPCTQHTSIIKYQTRLTNLRLQRKPGHNRKLHAHRVPLQR